MTPTKTSRLSLLEDIRDKLEEAYKLQVVYQARIESPDTAGFGKVLDGPQKIMIPIPMRLLMEAETTIETVAKQVATWRFVESARSFPENYITDDAGMVIFDKLQQDMEVLECLCVSFSDLHLT